MALLNDNIISRPELFGECLTTESLLLLFSLPSEELSKRLIDTFLDLLDGPESALNSVKKFFGSTAECLSQNINKAIRVTVMTSLEKNKERILRLLGYKELQSDGIRIVSYILDLNQNELKKFTHLVISEEFKGNADFSDFDEQSFFSVEQDQKNILSSNTSMTLGDSEKSQAIRSGIQYLEKLLGKKSLKEKSLVIISQPITAESDYVMTETAKTNLAAILESNGNPILIEGKDFSIKIKIELLKNNYWPTVQMEEFLKLRSIFKYDYLKSYYKSNEFQRKAIFFASKDHFFT